MARSKVTEPMILEAKNAEISVSRYSAQSNNVNISDLFLKWLGEGFHKANVTISITPLNSQNTITVGGKTVEVEELKAYVEEAKDE